MTCISRSPRYHAHDRSCTRLSDNHAIDQIALAEVRLLREAQAGDDGALRSLLEPHVDSVWSICTALMTETDALATVGSFQERLRTGVTKFALNQSFGIQLYGDLWATLSARLDAHLVAPPLVEPCGDALETLKSLPRLTALVTVFLDVTGLPSRRLAELTGLSEAAVDEHRARSATALAPWEATFAQTLRIKAPDGLLDLVKAPIPHAHTAHPRRLWITLIVLALFMPTALIVGAFLWATPSPPYAETHSLVSSPGAWLDPSDTALVEATYAYNQIPRPLWETPSLTHIGLTEVGIVVLPGAGTAVIYEDERANLLTLQRWRGDALPTYSGRATVGGIPLTYGEDGGVSIVAYAINGTVHVTTSTRPVQELVDLIRERLSQRG